MKGLEEQTPNSHNYTKLISSVLIRLENNKMVPLSKKVIIFYINTLYLFIFSLIFVRPLPVMASAPIAISTYCKPEKFKDVAWQISDYWKVDTQNGAIVVNWANACKENNDCYTNCTGPKGTHGVTKDACDSKFLSDMQNECANKLFHFRYLIEYGACRWVASDYYTGVKSGGWESYNDSCHKS
jgi:hypothetical protein